MCAPHGTETIELAWRETRPSTAEAGVSVRPPRANSAAAQANLREGDIIVAVDGQEIPTYVDLQAAIGKHDPGEQIHLQVRRGGGDPLEISLTRS